MANQGIIHLAYFIGGKTYCGNKRAIMSTTEADSHKWPLICAKCEAARRNREEKAQKKRATTINA